MTIYRSRHFVALVAVTVLAQGSRAFAQTAQGDPWRLVPPLPTACFADDDFSSRLDAAMNTINTEIEKQDKVNAAAKEKFDNMDMAEKAQRMQAFMMKDPQAAMKMMQAQQATGTAATSAVSDGDESVKRLTPEGQRLKANLRTTLEDAAKPVQARVTALIKAKTVSVGEAAVPMFTTAADHAQYVQLIAEENAAVERACAPFFGANGSFHKWLGNWRTDVTEKLITAGDGDAVVLQMQAMDLPGGGYRSTNPHRQVANYLQIVREAYRVRPARVQPKVELRK